MFIAPGPITSDPWGSNQKCSHRNSVSPGDVSCFRGGTRGRQNFTGEVGGVRTSNNHLSDPRKLKSWRAPKWWAFYEKVTPALKYGPFIFGTVLDFMGCTLLPENQKRKWMAWLGRYLSIWFRCQFLGCCHPLFFMEGFRKDSREGGPEGGSYRSHVPKQDSCFFVFGNMEISLFVRHFLCRLHRLIQHHDPDDHSS